MTKEERKLWYDFLRDYPVRFLRQKIIENYIVDFYCAAVQLVIELDGSQHYDEHGMSYDLQRTETLQQHGLTVLRFSNSDILQNFGGVCEHIDRFVKTTIQKG